MLLQPPVFPECSLSERKKTTFSYNARQGNRCSPSLTVRWTSPEFRKFSRKARAEDLAGSRLGGVAVFLYVKALGLLQVGCPVNKIKLYRFGRETFLPCRKREVLSCLINEIISRRRTCCLYEKIHMRKFITRKKYI